MGRTSHFSKPVLELLSESRYLGLRAGIRPHRFIGVWAVVVERRLFVRPWNDSASGWYRAFLEEPRGAIRVGEREVLVRARRVRAERVFDAVDSAYRAKYRTPAAKKYVRGFATPRRRATTIELVPR